LMRTFTGVPASAGVAIGRVRVYAGNAPPEVPRRAVPAGEVPAELERLRKAVSEAAGEVKALLDDAAGGGGDDGPRLKERADIFQAHLLMLEDAEFIDEIADRLKRSRRCAEWAVRDVSAKLCRKLMKMPDPAFRERAADVADVSRRIIDRLLCVTRGPCAADFGDDAVLVARDLMPSDALLLDKSGVKGIALDEGGVTSHTAILARAFGIPAVVGLSNASAALRDGQAIILNGSTGAVIVDPDAETLELQGAEKRRDAARAGRLSALRDLPAVTLDGHGVALLANIGFPEEADGLHRHGAEGVGLYRSEFLFMEPGKAADEEAQCAAYSRVLKAMGERPVTIRTMDVGGDKVAAGSRAADEKNPLLGCRAIRLSLANPDLFKTQLRALLRAGVHGNLRIMFPLICCAEEVEQARALLDEARAECAERGQPFADDVKVGIMVEVPSAAISADILAERSDFFSVGTNDLIQYSLAADRGNEKVSHLGDSHHPAVLRLVKRTIDAAREKGIGSCVCGELAGDPAATAILLGFGLKEFSMNAPAIPAIKEIIRGATMESCRALAAAVLRGRSVAEVRALVDEWMAVNFPGRG